MERESRGAVGIQVLNHTATKKVAKTSTLCQRSTEYKKLSKLEIIFYGCFRNDLKQEYHGEFFCTKCAKHKNKMKHNTALWNESTDIPLKNGLKLQYHVETFSPPR